MKIINTATADLSKLSPAEQLALYNGMDNLTLFEINSGLDELMTPEKTLTYQFEMELLAALLDMELAGIPVDTAQRDRLIREHEAELVIVQSHLHKLCSAIGYYDYYIRMAVVEYAAIIGIDPDTLPHTWADWLAQPITWRRDIKARNPEACAQYHKQIKAFSELFNGNSPSQKLRLFYHFFGSPANIESEKYIWGAPWNKTRGISEHKTRNTNGDYTPAVDRESLEKIEARAKDLDPADAHFWAWPFVKCCLEIADITKTLGFLRCKLERGVFRASFNAATETGRLNSKQNAQGYASNAQNVTPRLRIIFTAPKDCKFVAADYAQIESRCVASRCFVQFGALNYWNAVHSGDLHSLAASMVWPDLPWPADFTLDWLNKHGAFPRDLLKAAKAIASEPFYRGKSRRDVSKTLGHGTSYLGKPPQMSKMSHIDVKLIEHYQDVFFAAFPEIKQWHLWVVRQVQTVGEITTILGRTRRFFGRPNDDATIREAVAFDPQSTAADYCNRALLQLHKLRVQDKLPATIHLSKHDELVVSCRNELEAQVVKQLVETMESKIVLTAPNGMTRDLIIPAEVETGWNLSRMSKDNPDGLSHFGLERTRVNDPFNVWSQIL